jgi:hypothetical protein
MLFFKNFWRLFSSVPSTIALAALTACRHDDETRVKHRHDATPPHAARTHLCRVGKSLKCFQLDAAHRGAKRAQEGQQQRAADTTVSPARRDGRHATHTDDADSGFSKSCAMLSTLLRMLSFRTCDTHRRRRAVTHPPPPSRQWRHRK